MFYEISCDQILSFSEDLVANQQSLYKYFNSYLFTILTYEKDRPLKKL